VIFHSDRILGKLEHILVRNTEPFPISLRSDNVTGSRSSARVHHPLVFATKPAEFDPRNYLGAAREAITAMVRMRDG
jgi:hypothetical protein